MDRNREGRRASIVGSSTGGFNRRRHRTNSLRDSPDEDGGVEMQEPIRLRDRVKTDRDRERERDLRERERGRDLRERERGRDLRERSSRSKRRRADRLINGGDDTSEESVNDDEDDEDEETTTTAGGVRLLTPAMGHHQSHLNNHHHSSFSQQNHNSSSAATNNNTTNNNNNSNNISSSSNNNHNLQHRKSFPPPPPTAKVFKAPPVWRSGDEIITVSVPRKARSASTKRLQDWIASSSNNINNNNNSGSGITGGEASNSPVTAPPPPTSSSNPPMRKKLKPNGGGNNSGPKLKPPKVSSSSKPNSSNPEELEIEIAEVLYGLMTQSQAPSSKKEDSRDMNRSSSDTKSRVSSPISNSNSTNNHILGPNSSPFSVVAPKRKRPRQVVENSGYGARSSPVSARPETDQTPEIEISSSNTEKITGSVAESGAETNGYLVPETTALVTMKIDSEVKPLVAEELKESRDLVAKEEVNSPKEKESSTVRREDITAVDSTMIEANSMVENPREFEIDLMAPPPQARSSPERESVDQKPVLSVFDAEMKPALSKNNEDEKGNNVGEEKKGKGTSEEEESEKMVENKGRNIDLRLDLEKSERDGSNEVNASINKQHNQKQQLPIKASREESVTDKSVQPSRSLPLPMSMSGWPGGLPPMGYMAAPMAAAPMQGVVSIDGSTVTPAPPVQPPFPQPRPKRCATHCYIARNIHCLQHFVKMNPFWPAAAAGSASLFGSKPCNLNVLPAADLHGGVVNNVQDKGQNVANVSNHGGKDKNSSQSATTSDSAQRKQQILIQQALPPVAPNNLLGPAFIFPINQQQAAVAAAASARPSSTKLQTVGGGVAPPNVSTSGGASTAAGGVATAMSFNYPNMAPNETQYLAILQNGAYPFPIPAMAAPPQNYRGTPGQAMPMFNGSFYSSQMIHPSQLQHQQPPSTQPQQMPQALQNASVTGGSSSSQKHMQSQQPRPQSSGVSGGGGNSNLPKFPNQKSQPPQPFQQSQNQYMHPSQPRHRENEPGSEDSPSRTDGGGPRTSMNLYGQSFPMPMHPQNFALMTQPPSFGSGNQSEKKGQQPQQPGQKTGGDSLTPPHSFAMSFGPMNGTSGPGIDMSSMAQNHAIFQGFTEAARQNIQNIQMMSAAAAAQLARNFGRRHDDGDKSGTGVSTANDDERKSSGNAQDGGGQSIAFTRSDLGDASGPVTSSRSMPPNTGGVMNVPSAHIQAQIQQQQMLQLKQQQQHQHQQHQQQQQQQQQQQMTGGGVNRNKAPVTSNGIMYSERLNSTMTAKYPNAVSGFPQNLVQSNNNSPAQSPQWKNSTRTPTPQTPSPMSAASAANLKASMASAAAANLKNLPQQQSRTQQQMHTQISFGGGSQKLPTSQGQAPTNNNSAPAPPMMVGSPTNSSISKGAGGSPRTSTSTSTNNKVGQASSMSAQQPKNSQAIPNQRSSSILGNPLVSSSSNSGVKPQMQQQQQMPSKNTQPAQLFFSNPYSQAQPPHSSSSTTSGPSAYYMQHRRWTEQHQQQQQQPPGATTSSSGVLSLSPPVTMGSKGTNDPAKAIAAATGNVKGVGLNSQGIIQGAQFSGQLPAGFSYVHPVPAAVQVKPAEQKQSAGNDNMHQRQTDKK